MKRIISTIILGSLFLAFGAGISVHAGTEPITTVRMPQSLVDVLLNHIRSDIVPEIRLNLNPVTNHFEVQGKAKVGFVKLYTK